MGWAARSNLNSRWNKSRVGSPIAHNVQMSSPISNEVKQTKATIPARRQDEPMVIEINLRNIWGLLCRMLNLLKPKAQASHALNS